MLTQARGWLLSGHPDISQNKKNFADHQKGGGKSGTLDNEMIDLLKHEILFTGKLCLLIHFIYAFAFVLSIASLLARQYDRTLLLASIMLFCEASFLTVMASFYYDNSININAACYSSRLHLYQISNLFMFSGAFCCPPLCFGLLASLLNKSKKSIHGFFSACFSGIIAVVSGMMIHVLIFIVASR